ncbi:MAG: spirocyclase AveC family protein [Solirubrobacteraceae bacterium]
MAVETVTPARPAPGEGRQSSAAVDRPARTRPVLIWAAIGGLLVAFEVFVLARWLLGANFTATKPGPDGISGATHALYVAIQIAVPLAMLVVLYVFVISPWRRDGRIGTDGMLAISAGCLFFWDMNMNYTSVSLLYNSRLLNMGAWANGAFPGWTSPNGNLLPEPLLVCLPGYACMCFTQVVLMLAILRRIKRRWPGLGTLGTLATIVVGLTIIDTIIETILLRIGVYAYPGGIRAITLYAGHTYQLPMSEPFFFAGLGLGSVAALSHFRDDNGRTLVERGLERVGVAGKQRQAVKFLAIFAAVHLAFIVFYFVPNQWLATHAGPFPKGYKSYMINGMCDYPGGRAVSQTRGVSGVPCAGPGVAIPRPKSTL